MKRLAMVAVLLLIVACSQQGPQGPQGATGPTGPQGPSGPVGPTGPHRAARNPGLPWAARAGLRPEQGLLQQRHHGCRAADDRRHLRRRFRHPPLRQLRPRGEGGQLHALLQLAPVLERAEHRAAGDVVLRVVLGDGYREPAGREGVDVLCEAVGVEASVDSERCSASGIVIVLREARPFDAVHRPSYPCSHRFVRRVLPPHHRQRALEHFGIEVPRTCWRRKPSRATGLWAVRELRSWAEDE